MAPGGDQATYCTLRTTIWRSEGAQCVRVTPLMFIPVHRSPQPGEPALSDAIGSAGTFPDPSISFLPHKPENDKWVIAYWPHLRRGYSYGSKRCGGWYPSRCRYHGWWQVQIGSYRASIRNGDPEAWTELLDAHHAASVLPGVA